MSRLARRGLIGTTAGALGGVALALTLSHPLWGSLLGLAVGAVYAIATLPTREGYLDRLMSGGALGIPLWGLFSVIAIPVLSGARPQWGAAQMRGSFPGAGGMDTCTVPCWPCW